MDDQVAVNRAESDVDRLVHEEFFSGDRHGCICVEVGAARPDYLSVGSFFRRAGWRVISVEPNPVFCEMHRALGHEIYQVACGDRDEDGVEFSVVDSHGAQYQGGNVSYESFSSLGVRGAYAKLADGLPLEIAKITVQLRKLDTVLTQAAPKVRRIDLLVVDVEGWELEVLRGLDLTRYRPRVMIIENLFQDTAYGNYMRSCGYELWREAAPNEIYVRQGGRVERAMRWMYRLCSRLGSRTHSKAAA